MKLSKLLLAYSLLLFPCQYAWTQDTLDVITEVDRGFIEKPLSYVWGVDPFQKAPGFYSGEPREDKLSLSAIVHSDDGRSIAVINNQSAFVNSKINGHLVKEIGPNYVILEKNNSTQELQLSPIQQRQSSDISIWERLPAAESPDEQDNNEDTK